MWVRELKFGSEIASVSGMSLLQPPRQTAAMISLL